MPHYGQHFRTVSHHLLHRTRLGHWRERAEAMCIRNQDVQGQASVPVSSFVHVPKIGYIYTVSPGLTCPVTSLRMVCPVVSIIPSHHCLELSTHTRFGCLFRRKKSRNCRGSASDRIVLPSAASGAVTRTLRSRNVRVNLFWIEAFSPCSRSGGVAVPDDGVSIVAVAAQPVRIQVVE